MASCRAMAVIGLQHTTRIHHATNLCCTLIDYQSRSPQVRLPFIRFLSNEIQQVEVLLEGRLRSSRATAADRAHSKSTAGSGKYCSARQQQALSAGIHVEGLGLMHYRGHTADLQRLNM